MQKVFEIVDQVVPWRRPGLPVVLISGFSNTAIEEGEFVQLRKPCAPADLIAALHTALSCPARAADEHTAWA